MLVPFSKYSGCGNDFILIDNRKLFFPYQKEGLISQLCSRKKGIGADGLILLENSHRADYKMRIFNADGSEAEMCGNGVRCLMKFIHEFAIPKSSFQIETMLDQVHLEENGGNVSVRMPKPKNLQTNIPLTARNLSLTIHSVNSGVPHAVLFVDHLESDQWLDLAPEIRHHQFFAPQGTNVNFAKIEKDSIFLRTYERGVEGETLACGTGATATALVAATLFSLPSPIRIKVKSEEFLEVAFKREQDQFHEIKLTGPATPIFSGQFSLPQSH